jgi:hypothetical protein
MFALILRTSIIPNIVSDAEYDKSQRTILNGAPNEKNHCSGHMFIVFPVGLSGDSQTPPVIYQGNDYIDENLSGASANYGCADHLDYFL